MNLLLNDHLPRQMCDPPVSGAGRSPFFTSSLTFIAPAAVVEVHHHHCYQLCTAINAPFDSLIGKTRVTGSWGFVSNQNVSHSCSAPHSKILLHFIDAESTWGQTIRKILAGRDFLEINQLTTRSVPERPAIEPCRSF